MVSLSFAALGDQHFAVSIIEKMIKREPDERIKLADALGLLEPHISRV